jgi:hypothetical protein
MGDGEGHFSLEEWADFARGQLDPERRAQMQAHLDQGCRMCTQILDLWKSVLDVARKGKQFEPLESDIRWARALYAAYPQVRGSEVEFQVPRLVGRGRPALAGARGAGPALGHFMFQKEDLFLDLQFKVQDEGVSLAGQILNSAAQETRYRNTAVILNGEEGEITRTATNEFGEFRLEYRLQRNLVLVIELEDKSHLITPLPHTEG